MVGTRGRCMRCNKVMRDDEIIHARQDGTWQCDDKFSCWTRLELIEELRALEKIIDERKKVTL